MRIVAYSTIETAARSQGDLANAASPSSAEYMQWCNDEWAEIYEQLVLSGESYFLKLGTGTTASGTSLYALPIDFYKLRGVDVQLYGSVWFNAHRFNFERRNDYQFLGPSWVWPQTILYDLVGQALTAATGTVEPPQLMFLPTPSGNVSYRFWYFQPAVVLTQATDEMDLENGHEKCLTFAVAARAALKLRQFDFADRMIAERDKQMVRIVDSLRSMDSGEPKTIRIVRGRPAWRRTGRIGWWGQ